jgi:hypothetical protein
MWNVMYDTDIVLYRATLCQKWDDKQYQYMYHFDEYFDMKSTNLMNVRFIENAIHR